MRQYETLRAKLDDAFRTLMSDLDDAYYNAWKYQQSQPFFSWDVRNNVVNSKLQFDILHGMMHHIYTILQYKINLQDNDYNSDMLFGCDVSGTYDPIGRVTIARNWIQDKATQYSIDLTPIKTHIINWAQNQLSKTIDLE